MLQLLLISAFISVYLLMYTVLKSIYLKHQSAVVRVKKYIVTDDFRDIKDDKVRDRKQRVYKAGLGALSKGIGNARMLDSYKKKIQQRLVSAHILLKPEEYISLSIILFCSAAFISFMLSKNYLLTIIAAVLGWLSPGFVVKSKLKKRLKMLNEQINDAIVMISNSLKAGYSFFQAVDTVSKEMTGPIAEEFGIMLKEISLGQTTEKALENTAERIKSDDFDLLVTAVLIQRQVGGNLSEVLDSISSTIRGRLKIKGEIKTLTSQGRMSGIIISLLPPVLGLLIYMINPEHMRLLFNNAIGIGIIIFSIFMELTGIYFVKKIVKIEV